MTVIAFSNPSSNVFMAFFAPSLYSSMISFKLIYQIRGINLSYRSVSGGIGISIPE